MTADLASQIVVLTALAFVLWLALLWPLRKMDGGAAGLIAAVLSWVGASASAGWLVTWLRHARFWPLV
jgi:hypothetical protein